MTKLFQVCKVRIGSSSQEIKKVGVRNMIPDSCKDQRPRNLREESLDIRPDEIPSPAFYYAAHLGDGITYPSLLDPPKARRIIQDLMYGGVALKNIENRPLNDSISNCGDNQGTRLFPRAFFENADLGFELEPTLPQLVSNSA